MSGLPEFIRSSKTGYTELIRRMEKEYGMDQLDSYQLLNLMGK